MAWFKRFASQQPGLQEQIQVLRNIAALLKAKLTLTRALTAAKTNSPNHELKRTLDRINNQIQAGQPLSAALALEPAFPQLVSALVRTGESTGTLSTSLDYAAEILELRHQGRQNLFSALAYPAIVMGVTLLAAIFLATVIAPQIGDMYQRMGHELPLLTRFVIAGGNVSLILVAIVAIFITIKGSSNKSSNDTAGFPAFLQRMANIVPIFRAVNETHGTALWTRCLGVLLSRGIALPEAMAMTAEGAAGPLIRHQLLTARQRIIAGDPPAEAFQSIDTCPDLTLQILASGDSSGDLAQACQQAYEILDSDYKNRVRRMLALAEPLAVLVAGCLVILVALAVMLPVAELGGLL